MRLSEDRQVVEALNQILEEYPYLEYDEERHQRDRNFGGLQINVRPKDKRDVQVIWDIRERLGRATNRDYFFTYGGSYPGADNFAEAWTYFTLREF